MGHILMDSDLKELEKDTGIHTCCDICQKGCECENCELLLLERLIKNDVYSDTDNKGSEYLEKTEDYWGITDDPELDFDLDI